MKRRSIYFSACVSLFVLLSLLIGQSGKADYPPGNWRYDQQDSKEAGLLFYRALYLVYLSLWHLENGDIDKANNVLGTSLKHFGQVSAYYQRIVDQVPDQEIPINRIRSDVIATVKQNFKSFDVPFPNTWKKLAETNKEQVNKFVDSIKEIKYVGDSHKNRELIRQMNEAIHRIMSLGVSISEIASVKL